MFIIFSLISHKHIIFLWPCLLAFVIIFQVKYWVLYIKITEDPDDVLVLQRIATLSTIRLITGIPSETKLR